MAVIAPDINSGEGEAVAIQILETTTDSIDLEALAALALNPYNNAEVRGTGAVFIAVQSL